MAVAEEMSAFEKAELVEAIAPDFEAVPDFAEGEELAPSVVPANSRMAQIVDRLTAFVVAESRAVVDSSASA